MKLNNSKNKKIKINKEFDPVSHWYSLLLIVFVLFLLIIGYSVYTFIYTKEQISLMNTGTGQGMDNSTSTDSIQKNKENNQFLKGVNNLNKTLEKYSQKEIEFNRLLNTVVSISKASTTASSTSIATSTK